MSDTAFYAIIAIGVVLVLATIVGAVILGRRVYVTGKYLQSMGAGGKFAFWGSLIYTISPVDLLPDPIYLDDLGVLGIALVFLTRLATKVAKQRRAGTLPQHPAQTPVAQRHR